MRRAVAVGLMCLMVSASTPTVVWAQDGSSMSDAERAKKIEELAIAGAKLFQAKEYEKAIKKFEEAYNLEEVPNLLYNIGKCYEKLEQWDKAIDHYKKFAVADNVDSAARQDALESIERLQEVQQIAKKAEEDEAKKAQEEANKGNDDKKDDKPKTKLVEPDHTVAYVLGGVGLGLLATGGVFGFLTNGKQSDFDAAQTPEERRDAADSGKTMALVADISYGVGAAALLTGVILWATASPEEVPVEDGATAARLNPWFSPQGAGVTYEVRF